MIHTPGHTPDSVCYRVGGAVLTGDTLLIGGSGRTDFPGGDAGAQYDAVTARLFALPDDTVVLARPRLQGQHRVDDRRREAPQPALRSARPATSTSRSWASLGLPFPEKIQQSLQVNQSGFEADEVALPAGRRRRRAAQL